MAGIEWSALCGDLPERIALGTWQGIYLIEHRDRGHRRELVLSAVGA